MIEAIAATQGVYSRQKARRLAAESDVILPSKAAVFPNRIESVDTTLSFAINPVIRAVEILQSPYPIGLKIGAITLATIARILSLESVTMLRCVLNVCRNQITSVAMKITVNALCRKSFALSQRRCPTFFAPGIR